MVTLNRMHVLPSQPIDPLTWAYQAWAESGDGAAITVPASALRALLDAYVIARRALEDDVRATLSAAVADDEPSQRTDVSLY